MARRWPSAKNLPGVRQTLRHGIPIAALASVVMTALSLLCGSIFDERRSLAFSQLEPEALLHSLHWVGSLLLVLCAVVAVAAGILIVAKSIAARQALEATFSRAVWSVVRRGTQCCARMVDHWRSELDASRR